MIQKMLEKRQGHEIHDEDTEAYILGIKDALEALESDEVYYNALRASSSMYQAIGVAVHYVKGDWFK